MKATPINPGHSYLVTGQGFNLPVMAKNACLAICFVLNK